MAARKTTTNTTPTNDVNSEDRARMVAEAAYFHAVNRGFQNGSPESDWIAAEQEIDAMLAKLPKPQTQKKAS